MTTELKIWLKQATRHLSKDSAAQVQTEIQEHYESAREAAISDGSALEEAARFALAGMNGAVRGDGAVAVVQDLVSDEEREFVFQPLLLAAQTLIDQHRARRFELRSHQRAARLAGWTRFSRRCARAGRRLRARPVRCAYAT